MKRSIFLLILLFSNISISAQNVFGKWKTYDIFDHSKEESIVQIYKLNDKLYIRIDKIIPVEHREDLCHRCTGKNKGKPIRNLIILEGAVLDNGIWKGAKILNAKNGKHYGCHISLAENDLLKVRGFIGYPVFGKTTYWTRVKNRSFK